MNMLFDDEPHYADDHLESDYEDRSEDGLSDVEADAMTLASCGWGTDEDYGCYSCDDSF
jgi:hypothetical protein